MNFELINRIAMDPGILAGKPFIRGTRLPVDMIVRMVAQGIENAQILKEYPRLTQADIKAALIYAAGVVADEDVFPVAAIA